MIALFTNNCREWQLPGTVRTWLQWRDMFALEKARRSVRRSFPHWSRLGEPALFPFYYPPDEKNEDQRYREEIKDI